MAHPTTRGAVPSDAVEHPVQAGGAGSPALVEGVIDGQTAGRPRRPRPGLHLDAGAAPRLWATAPFTLRHETVRRARALVDALDDGRGDQRVHDPRRDGTRVRTRDDEIVHVHLGTTGPVSGPALGVALTGGAVVHLHATRAVPLRHGTSGTLRNRLVDATVEQLVLRRSRLVVAATRRLAEVADDAGAETVVVVPPAALPVATPSDDWRPVPRRIVAVGPLTRTRRSTTLVRALVVQPADTELWLAGDGPEAAAVRAEAVRLAVADRVHHLANPTWQQVADLLASAGVVAVAGSCGEHLSPPLLAMALGRPVVATAVEGLPDVIADGIDGVLVSPTDADALAAAIRDLVTDPERATAIGAAAGRRAASGWDQRAARLELLLAAHC